MSHFLAEMLGTMILVLLGDGVVANCLLGKTKGNNAGLIVIATGWAFAVGIPAWIFGAASGAHFNPALTLGLATIGKFPWADVPTYIAGQMLGGFLGACLVYIHYLPHWAATEDKDAKLAVFCTGPAIKSTPANFISEFIGTFILVFGILGLGAVQMAPGLNTLAVAFLIWVIGVSLGGTTGYAINPARDLGPRIAHFLLPIPGKRDSDWGYSWIPVIAPICGAVVAALFYHAIF
ncbi:MIP/aquaporin family protein [Candidatus Clostridium radicumherbarum]|uniref:MIP/aquaporin family protein n=1 Tax=Candidatus Clostridium radicumherbarum TaxID=3381662 RepID=A0ABW8TTF3_9CLOT